MSSQTASSSDHVEIRGNSPAGAEQILTPEAVAFVAGLARKFEATRQ